MLSIGEFSEISKVTTKTLRYYDKIGLLEPSFINEETGYRYYKVEQLETILFINRLKDYTFSLDEIFEILQSPKDNRDLQSKIYAKRELIQENIYKYNLIINQLDKDIENLERGIEIMAYLDEIPVKIFETKDINIYSVRKKINIEKDYKGIREGIFHKIVEERLSPTGAPMTIFHDEEFDPENYDMELAIPVKENYKGTRVLMGGLCAMVTLKGPFTELPSAYAKINEWIEKEGYELAGSPYEIYVTDPTTTAPDEFITEVYCPIKKK